MHQGDGTADCLRDEPDLFTFSMHAEKNYPVRKIPSDLDIGLPDSMEDDAIWSFEPICRAFSMPLSRISCSSMRASIRIGTTSSDAFALSDEPCAAGRM